MDCSLLCSVLCVKYRFFMFGWEKETFTHKERETEEGGTEDRDNKNLYVVILCLAQNRESEV